MDIYFPLREISILSSAKHNTFGMVRKKGTKAHQGWDLQAKNDSPLFAAFSGTVVSFDRVDDSSYGKSILIKHNDEELYAFYAHINSSLVERKMEVEAGKLIGFSGSTGNAKGSKPWEQHLHFEIRKKRYCGNGLEGRVDPAKLYGPPPFYWMCIDSPLYFDPGTI